TTGPKRVGHFELAKLRQPHDQRDLSPPDLNEIELSARDGAGDLKGSSVRSVAGDLLRQSFNVLDEYGGCGDAVRKTMSIGIPARPFLAGARTGSRTLSRIAPVRGDLSFRCHGCWDFGVGYSPNLRLGGGLLLFARGIFELQNFFSDEAITAIAKQC